jgi:hypothetical protein
MDQRTNLVKPTIKATMMPNKWGSSENYSDIVNIGKLLLKQKISTDQLFSKKWIRQDPRKTTIK